jgi:uncharacterized protein (TIGR02246 family)
MVVGFREENTKMKTCQMMAVIAACCVVLVTGAQTPAAGGDEAAVRAVAQRELEGWNKFDAAQVASCYTEHPIWQNPFGVQIRSREKLQKFLTNLFQRPGYRSAKVTAPPVITDVRMLSPTSAVVWSEEKSEGQIDDATGKAMKPRYSHYFEALVKQDGAWLISDSIIMDEYPRP